MEARDIHDVRIATSDNPLPHRSFLGDCQLQPLHKYGAEPAVDSEVCSSTEIKDLP